MGKLKIKDERENSMMDRSEKIMSQRRRIQFQIVHIYIVLKDLAET